MSDKREKLAPLVGNRLKVRGQLDKYRDWDDGGREVGRACIRSPEVEGEVICTYVWVLGVLHWDQKGTGQQVEFDAVVRRYVNHEGENYSLESPSALVVVQPPALRIPDPVPEVVLAGSRPAPTPVLPAPVPNGEAPSTPVAEPRQGSPCEQLQLAAEVDRLGVETVAQVLTLLHRAGSVERLQRVVDFLKG
jgi:hypothetical protein